MGFLFECVFVGVFDLTVSSDMSVSSDVKGDFSAVLF